MENVVKSMLPRSELKVTPSFFFSFKIPDNPTITIIHYSPFVLNLEVHNMDSKKISEFNSVNLPLFVLDTISCLISQIREQMSGPEIS